MFNFLKKKPLTPLTTDTVIIGAVRLKPNRKYLLIFDKHSLEVEDMRKLSEELKRSGFNIKVSVAINGDPTTAVKVIEQETE